jgi:DNA-binding LytR/AlgR family response regulator
MLKIAITDDNSDDAARLAEEIGRLVDAAAVSLFRFDSGEAFLASEEPYDLVFMDIYMTGMTGLQTIEKYRRRSPDCPVIFTTTSKEHALEAFALEAEQYLIKPIMPEGIKRIITKHLNKYNPFLRITFERKPLDVPFSGILYLEIKGRAVIVHTENANYTVWNTRLADLMAQLQAKNQPSAFLHCHKSYVVNLNFVDKLDGDFILKNGERVYITRTRVAELRREWQRFILRKTEAKFTW